MKKILLSMLLILTISILTGCDKKEEKITIEGDELNFTDIVELKDMSYKVDPNKFDVRKSSSSANVFYEYKDEVKMQVVISFYENKTTDDLTKDKKAQGSLETKKIGKYEYTYYEDKNLKDGKMHGLVDAHAYVYTYNNTTYVIRLYVGNTMGELENLFMKNVSFK